MNDEKIIDLAELRDLLNVPEIARSLKYTVEKFKSGEYAQKIKMFNEKRKALKEALFESFSRDKGKDRDQDINRNILYWFELDRVTMGYWDIINLEPRIPPYYEKYEILPEDLVRMIGGYPANPDRVERLIGVKSRLYGKNYDLHFTVFSPYYAVGTVIENPTAREERIRGMQFTWNEQLDVAYKVLFYYMEQFPPLRDYLFNEFFEILKPAVDEKRKEDKKLRKS
jgi:hypothetical protein